MQRRSDDIEGFLENRYVFNQFWKHHHGEGFGDWKSMFKNLTREAQYAMLELTGRAGSMPNSNRTVFHTRAVLVELFERLYVLRNQLMHGASTWKGSRNRKQVSSGAKIMELLVPLFVFLMLSKRIRWGPPSYPPVDD